MITPIEGTLIALGTDESTEIHRALVKCTKEHIRGLKQVELMSEVTVISTQHYADLIDRAKAGSQAMNTLRSLIHTVKTIDADARGVALRYNHDKIVSHASAITQAEETMKLCQQAGLGGDQ